MSRSPFLFSSALPPLSQFTNPMVKSTPRPFVFCNMPGSSISKECEMEKTKLAWI